MLIVLRLGHRVVRDQRLTTHVCLAARAFGADGILVAGENDEKLISGVQKVAQKWGGEFFIRKVGNWKAEMEKWKKSGGKIAHLTMYGEPVQKIAARLRMEKNLMIVVGAEKVESEVYRMADYNVAVANQPHSEVAALAIVLDRVHEGKELEREFKGAEVIVKPNKCGKSVFVCKK